MNAFEQIARLNFKIHALEDEVLFLKKCNAQKLETYECWNKIDIKRISELLKENKELKQMIKSKEAT